MRTDLYLSLKRAGIDPTMLKDLHRILLTTDGTLTDILEAYYREQMQVVVLKQELSDAPLDATRSRALGLDPESKTQTLRREVFLEGQISGSRFVYAESFIVVDRLLEPVRRGLLERQVAIGHLILQARIATFKEIVGCGREPAEGLAKDFQIRPDAPLLSRTYVLTAHDRPIMLITEKFPEWGR